MLTEDASELYTALAWKRDHEDCENKYKADKIASLCEWYEREGMFTKKQIEFGNELLKET